MDRSVNQSEPRCRNRIGYLGSRNTGWMSDDGCSPRGNDACRHDADRQQHRPVNGHARSLFLHLHLLRL